MVRQHPRRRRADGGRGRQRLGDGRDQLRRVPRAHEEVEVERLVHLRRADVAHEPFDRLDPRLPTEDASGVVVHVEDLTPLLVDLVDALLVPERMPGPVGREVVLAGVEQPQRAVPVGQGRVLDQPVGDVDPEPGHPAVEPEPEDVEELGAHLRVRPVEVGLLAVEKVEVPLAGFSVVLGHAGPGDAAEDRRPVVRRLVAARTLAVSEDVPSPLR